MNKLTKDHVGGALLLAVGIAVVVAGKGYGVGTLRSMGSGFFPVVLGVLLALIGAFVPVLADLRLAMSLLLIVVLLVVRPSGLFGRHQAQRV